MYRTSLWYVSGGHISAKYRGRGLLSCQSNQATEGYTRLGLTALQLVVSAESITPMYYIYINAPNCCTAAYQHLEQSPNFRNGDLRLGTLLPMRAPNWLQSIIDRLSPAEVPKEVFRLDYSKQSYDSGDRLHCNNHYHPNSGKCSVT